MKSFASSIVSGIISALNYLYMKNETKSFAYLIDELMPFTIYSRFFYIYLFSFLYTVPFYSTMSIFLRYNENISIKNPPPKF